MSEFREQVTLHKAAAEVASTKSSTFIEVPLTLDAQARRVEKVTLAKSTKCNEVTKAAAVAEIQNNPQHEETTLMSRLLKPIKEFAWWVIEPAYESVVTFVEKYSPDIRNYEAPKENHWVPPWWKAFRPAIAWVLEATSKMPWYYRILFGFLAAAAMIGPIPVVSIFNPPALALYLITMTGLSLVRAKITSVDTGVNIFINPFIYALGKLGAVINFAALDWEKSREIAKKEEPYYLYKPWGI